MQGAPHTLTCCPGSPREAHPLVFNAVVAVCSVLEALGITEVSQGCKPTSRSALWPMSGWLSPLVGHRGCNLQPELGGQCLPCLFVSYFCPTSGRRCRGNEAPFPSCAAVLLTSSTFISEFSNSRALVAQYNQRACRQNQWTVTAIRRLMKQSGQGLTKLVPGTAS